MRLDKFLKVSRLIKRRTIAKEMAEKGRITIGSNVAKPSTGVNVGNIIKLSFGSHRILVIEITKLAEHVKKEEAIEMYKVISDTRC